MMQARQLQETGSLHEYDRQEHASWRCIGSSAGSRNSCRKRAQIRKWRRIQERSGAAMLTFVPLFFLVWLGISMLSPRNHMAVGVLLLLILAAEAVSVSVHLVSDLMLQHLRYGL